MKYLVIGPGGQNFYSYLGALKCIENEIDEIEEISGASSGSLLSFLLCLGKSMDEIIDFGFKIDQATLGKFKLKNLFTKYGLIDSMSIKNKIVEILGCDPTFKELEKKLTVSVYNLNFHTTQYISKDTHPDLSAIQAVCMSMSIPLLFTSVLYNGAYYVDGGLFEQAPLFPFFDKESSDITILQTQINQVDFLEIKNLKEFISSLFFSCRTKITDPYDSKKYNIININQMDDVSSINFNMDHETKWKLYFHGYNIAEQHYNK